MKSIALLITLVTACTVFAENTLPVRTHDFGQILPEGKYAANWTNIINIDLREYFDVPDVHNQVVQFDSNLGKFNVELFPADAPKSVANFLRYCDANAYENTIIHRSIPNSGLGIIQGGGFKLTPESSNYLVDNVASFAAIELEYKLPNARGTIAMARTSALNSATSQWFINTADNTTNLGQSNGGGYAVFGRVIGTGMTVADTIVGKQRYNFGSPLNELPLSNYTDTTKDPTRSMFIKFNSIRRINKYPATNEDNALLDFEIGNVSNPGNAVITLRGSFLSLEFPAAAISRTEIQIVAKDVNGNTASGTLIAAPEQAAFVLGTNFAAGNSIFWRQNFGFSYTAHFPWIYLFDTQRWYFSFGPSTDNLWLWNPERGFLWTQADLYPTVYSAELGTFVNDRE
ncbi:MAG: peptidylprolyl isomerase [Verrucomicrobiota bacterium]|nr:peptidylprolyl isomerase [Verrucomicrobiota bacterium]